MNRDDFARYFVERTMGVHQIHVVTEDYRDEDRPVGAIFLTGNGQAFETHAEWMPWASRRDILTASLTFIMKMRKKMTLMMPIPEENGGFLEHLGRYGVLRKVGFIEQYYKNGNAVLWQSRYK